VEIPMKKGNPLERIISYLTKKHGGNVHEKGIVTITSKSVDDDPEFAPQNLADLTSESEFLSKKAPGQWVCWDFREMRVRPTHYTIGAFLMKWWIVEGSLDGESWTAMDQQTSDQTFKNGVRMRSFAVTAKCRFIRLTQTANQPGHHLALNRRAAEFFGTLSE
jgi:hypothetical protein